MIRDFGVRLFVVLTSAMGLGCVKTFRSGPKLLPTGWRAPSSALNRLFLSLETLLKLPEVILSDLESLRQPAAQVRIAARSGFTPTMFISPTAPESLSWFPA
jgi:hypothetical protein